MDQFARLNNPKWSKDDLKGVKKIVTPPSSASTQANTTDKRMSGTLGKTKSSANAHPVTQ